MRQTSSEIKEYKHLHVLSQPGEFRLMRLKQQLNRTTADEVLTISFQHANLDDQMCEYVALSYAWGNAKPTTRIQVKSGRRIFFKLITPTLEAALRQLQLGHTSRLVWADALCINQEPDSEEKNMQVMQMDRIYNSAKSVHVWLGPSSVESDLAMKFIRRISRQVFWDLGPFVSNASYGPSWKAVRALITRPWFSRRWILQEILLARRATVICGDKWTCWSNLECTIQILLSNLQEIKGLLRRSMEANFLPVDQRNLHIPWNAHVHETLQVVIRELLEPFEGIPDSTAGNLVRWRERIVSHSQDGKVEKLATLQYLILTFAGFQVSEYRDAVYALCALASDGGGSPANPIIVDYHKPVLEVFSNFVSYCIQSSRSLDIIMHPWAPTLKDMQEIRWPSWIRSSAGSEFTQGSDGQLRRINGALLTGMPATYSVSGTTSPITSTAIKKIDSDTVYAKLSVAGFSVDTINNFGSVSTGGVVPYDWHEIVEWEGDKLEDAPQDFLLGIVGGRQLDHLVAPHRSPSLHNASIWKAGDRTKPDFSKAYELSEDAALGQVHAVTFGRRIFVTADQKLIGLGPSGMKQGDLVCILYGCSVPVILRPVTNCSEGNFKIVGEAYVHSIMNGDCVKDSIPVKTFVLV